MSNIRNRIDSLERASPPLGLPRIWVVGVCAKRGSVSVMESISGRMLRREDDESEASFMDRAERTLSETTED